uniref:Uncharacterized protein n=1 Tax=Anopheles minimus TaxID=112268 RepID=A0A182WN65_9DIPT
MRSTVELRDERTGSRIQASLYTSRRSGKCRFCCPRDDVEKFGKPVHLNLWWLNSMNELTRIDR